MSDFILPPKHAIQDRYSLRNYYLPGPIGWVKRRRFDVALKLARPYNGTAIDMGCADGVFLPTLSRLYERVIAIDVQQRFIDASQRLVAQTGLTNVDVINGSDARGICADVVYCLETIEHVGCQPDMWGSKRAFVDHCLGLLRPGGRLIISVPKMTGFAMAIKAATGRDRMPITDLARSVFRCDTRKLESRWDGGHIGFSHERLESETLRHFRVERRVSGIVTVFYVLVKH